MICRIWTLNTSTRFLIKAACKSHTNPKRLTAQTNACTLSTTIRIQMITRIWARSTWTRGRWIISRRIKSRILAPNHRYWVRAMSLIKTTIFRKAEWRTRSRGSPKTWLVMIWELIEATPMISTTRWSWTNWAFTPVASIRTTSPRPPIKTFTVMTSFKRQWLSV